MDASDFSNGDTLRSMVPRRSEGSRSSQSRSAEVVGTGHSPAVLTPRAQSWPKNCATYSPKFAAYVRSEQYALRNGKGGRGLTAPGAAEFLCLLYQADLRRLLHVLGDDATQRKLVAIGALRAISSEAVR